jgi:starvation-inducible outer membrane lipoprotein
MRIASIILAMTLAGCASTPDGVPPPAMPAPVHYSEECARVLQTVKIPQARAGDTVVGLADRYRAAVGVANQRIAAGRACIRLQGELYRGQ